MKRRAQIFGVVRRKIQFLGDKCLKWRVKSVKLIYFLKDFRYLEFHKIIEKIKIFSMYFGGKKGGILVIPACLLQAGESRGYSLPKGTLGTRRIRSLF